MKFLYTAKNQAGEVRSSEMEASSERDVAESLRGEGFWIISIKAQEIQSDSSSSSFSGSFRSVPLKSKMIFCRHLAVMIGSGLSLARALSILASQEKSGYFKKVIGEISIEVKKGVMMADAMAKYAGVFDSVFVSMVKVGEVSGNLENILNILSSQLEKDHKLVSKIKGAMIYPAVILSVMVVIGILVMIFVVPKITAIFKDFDAQLPFLTRAVIAVSDFMAGNSILTIGGLIAVVVFFRFFLKTNPGKKIFHKVFLKAPMFGSVVVKVNSARFARILASLLESGVSLVEALKITSDTLGNYYFKKAVKSASEEVQKGIPLSQVIFNNRDVFPYLIVQMIEVGEETGKTSSVLLKLAGFYEEEVDQITRNMSSIIEPVLMVVIGAAVGFFAIAIIQPIYSIMGKM